MPRGDRLRREWLLLQKLDRPQGATLAELADALPDDYPKHPRTIRRDLEALESVFPLYTEREDGETRWHLTGGRAGAPPLLFTQTELMALTFCRGLLTELEGTPVKESLGHAVEKITATLPEKVRHYLRTRERAFSCGPEPHKEYEAHKGTIDGIYRALDEGRAVKINYASHARGATVWREVDPYNMRFHQGGFYLVGNCHLRHEVRIFAVDRIKKLDLLTRRYEIPADFNIDQYMATAFGVMRGEPVDLQLLFDAPTAKWVAEHHWHPTQRTTEHPDKTLTLRLRVALTPELKAWVLSFGAGAKVVKPRKLKELIAEEVGRMGTDIIPKPKSRSRA